MTSLKTRYGIIPKNFRGHIPIFPVQRLLREGAGLHYCYQTEKMGNASDSDQFIALQHSVHPSTGISFKIK